ncbi:MAG: hypothetical protein H6739_01460 [Alphaproteobacteria bacterium]|nr:hypothetical protein [Alphaproteobacteria bacterium]
MRRHTLMFAAVFALLAACDSSPPPEPAPPPEPVAEPAPPATDPRVEQAVRLARAIDAAPENAAALLADAGLTLEQLDALMYEIAEDPQLSRQYAEQRGAD